MSAAVDMRRKKSSAAAKKRKAKVSALKNSRPKRAATISDVTSVDLAAGWGWRGVGAGVVLLVLCVGLGVQVSQQSQRMRALYSELQQDQQAQDALLAERSKLLLERGTLNSYSAAEAIARERLDMRFPEAITRVEVAGSSGQQLIRNRAQR